MSQLSEAIMFLGMLGLAGFLAWLFAVAKGRRGDLLRQHLEGRNRLLDRIESPQELLAFARTEEGKAILTAPQFPAAEGLGLRKPGHPGLYLVIAGIISLGAGMAFRSTYYVLSNWQAANLKLPADEAAYQWRHATEAWSQSALLLWVGAALVLGGLLSAGLHRWARGTESASN